MAEGGVSVAEGNDGDVDVRGLADGLVVDAGVGDDDDAGLLERTGDVVGEGTGGEAAGNGSGTSVGGELEDGTVAEGAARDDTDVSGVLDGSEDAGSEDELLPGLADVDQVDTWWGENTERVGSVAAHCVTAVNHSRKCHSPSARRL